MKASELIIKLQAEIEKGGDADVLAEDEYGYESSPTQVTRIGADGCITIQTEE